MYQVIKDFVDIQDNNYLYRAGDAFPRVGVDAGKDRIRELLLGKNRCGEVLIKELEKADISAESEENEPAEETVVKEIKKPKKANKKEK